MAGVANDERSYGSSILWYVVVRAPTGVSGDNERNINFGRLISYAERQRYTICLQYYHRKWKNVPFYVLVEVVLTELS